MIKLPVVFSLIILIACQYCIGEQFNTSNTADTGEKTNQCISVQSSEYPFLTINNNEIIVFNKEYFNAEGVPFPFNYRIKVEHINCNTNRVNNIDLLPYEGEPGKINDVFIYKTKNDHSLLFIIYSASSPSHVGIPYSSDTYFIFVYNNNKGMFSLDNRQSGFWSNGADIADFENESYGILNIYTFPYKNKNAILTTLSSNLYKKWESSEPIEGTILTKTKLQESSFYYEKEKKYLIKGDSFVVKDMSAGWLLIDYQNPKKGKITGWVMCQDTTVCQGNN